LPDLLKRFDTITLKIWEKYGIRQVGFWTTVIGGSNQALTYLIAWESLAEREKKVERLPGRSRMAEEAGRKRRGQWPDRGQYTQTRSSRPRPSRR